LEVAIKVPLLPRKPVAVDFGGGDLSSDAGLIPLALADQRMPVGRSTVMHNPG